MLHDMTQVRTPTIEEFFATEDGIVVHVLVDDVNVRVFFENEHADGGAGPNTTMQGMTEAIAAAREVLRSSSKRGELFAEVARIREAKGHPA
jgi:hypothetical protein